MSSLAAFNAALSPPIVEGWGDQVDYSEMLRDYDWYGGGSGALGIVIDQRDDRKEGQDRPVFETEQQLAEIRGWGRYLAGQLGAGVAIQSGLTNYTIGTGLTYKANQVKGQDVDKALIAAVQRVLDTFADDNDWIGDYEREIHSRSRRDGEAFVALLPKDGHTEAKIVEPAHVVEPLNTRELEDWLGDCDVPCTWRFGVHRHLRNLERPLGHHVVYDGTGADFDYFPADDLDLALRIKTGLMEHIKTPDADRVVCRGISEYWPVRRFLLRAEKLLGNMGEGAAIQAAIALIREWAAGVGGSSSATQSQMTSMVSSQAYDRRDVSTPLGTKSRYVQKFDSGTVVDMPSGKKYHAGPLGAGASAPNFTVVEQALLRYVGIRWHFPEYLISGDASNANYSSTLVAESPFVKSREADQRYYVSRFKRIGWKVIQIAHAAGVFGGIDFSDIEAQVELTVEAPTVASRNAVEETSRNKVLADSGVLSRETWAAREGLALEDEVAKGAIVTLPASPFGLPGLPDSEQSPPPQDGQAPQNIASDEGLNGAQITAAIDVLAGVSAGTTAELVAVELLVAVGIEQDKAQRMVKASAAIKAASPEEVRVAESEAAKLWEAYMPAARTVRKEVKRDAKGLIAEIVEVQE